MLSGKTVSIYSILERLFRTSAFTKHINLNDAIELAGEAILLIGAPTALVDKITDGNTDNGHPAPIEIKGYKGALPCDLYEVIQTRTYTSKTPMRYATNTFHGGLLCAGSVDTTCNSDITYKLTGGAIHASFKTGKIEMAYRAFYLDEHGLPLIPAEERYMKGIESYLKYQFYKPLWELGKIRDAVWNHTEQEYLFYMASASNQAKMQGLDEMITVKNAMLQMIPDVMTPENYFQDFGTYPAKHNHNNAGSWSR
jgi:hypothetical protein